MASGAGLERGLSARVPAFQVGTSAGGGGLDAIGVNPGGRPADARRVRVGEGLLIGLAHYWEAALEPVGGESKVRRICLGFARWQR